MRQGLSAVLLCLLVAGAGCSAIPGTGGGNEDVATANDVAGIGNGTLENESALLDAHVDAVTETGFAQEISANLTDAAQGETFEVSQRQRTSVSADAAEYRFQVITNGRISTRVLGWSNGSVELIRAETGGGEPQYQTRDPSSAGTLAGRAALERRLSSEFEVTDVEQRDGQPDIVTLRVDELPEENDVFDQQEEIDTVREFDAELVVDTDGRIHSYAAVGVYDIEGETADYEYNFQMTSFEDPGVEKPEWADQVQD